MEKEVKKKFDEIEERLNKLEDIVLSEDEEFQTLEDRKENFAEEIGVETGKLDHMFDIDWENQDIDIVKDIERDTNKEEHIEGTICLLTAYSYILDEDEIKSSILKEKLRDLGMNSLQNLGTNLSEVRKFIRPKGKPRSNDYKYEIRPLGKKEGLKHIKKILDSIEES